MRFNPIPRSIQDAYRARHEPEAQRLLGNFYWSILVILLFIIMCTSIGYGAWEFQKPITHGVEESVSVGTKKVITRIEIEKVLQAFEARSAEYDARLKAPALAQDPS